MNSFVTPLAILMLIGGLVRAADIMTPTDLRCEDRKTPLNVDLVSPRLSWILKSDRPGQAQSAYEISVASAIALLDSDKPDLWNTGKVSSDQSIQIAYAGKPLTSGGQCFWKVRTWNQDGQPSPWSETSVWAMGMLSSSDWKASWITGAFKSATPSSALGYHAAVTQNAEDTKWVQIDLSTAKPIDIVKLHSLDHEVAGFGFPIRFTVAASDDPNFSTFDIIADESHNDFRNPGFAAVDFKANHITRRFVRVTANRLFRRTIGDRTCCFALAELEVISGGKNIALHAPVTAKDSVEDYGWSKAELTDGQGLAPDTSATADDGTISTLPIFLKAWQVSKPISRAVMHICGLGQYELRINGRKIGDSVMDPGWTDYRKTCLYQSYDVTADIKNGSNVIGVLLGNGMYNVQSPADRYHKFDASMGPPKLIAQLQIYYSDGSSDQVCSDTSWQVAGGPITFSNVYGGEDYDARLEQSGWDADATNASDARSGHWQPAISTSGPGGALAGVSRSALPIRVSTTLKAEKILHPRPDIWVYDFGQNCSQLPSITVNGTAGASVRLTPGELLNHDGTVSQESSGGPAYFTYVLKGTPLETWSPRFSYYGYRYLQVSGAVPEGSPNPTHLPEISNLQGKVITSDAPIAGEFSCSNPLFNRTAEIIRWAMRNNMMSVLTDCPHREKLGWLEESHLVGPSLMYNFQIAPLFSKICGDTTDSQLDSGLVPDISPEYAVFGGGFRDSPEWGSASVLIPWQLYEWYGDTGILTRQYDTMKRYVQYLGTRANNNILTHGLGDWYDLGPKPPGEAQLTPRSLTATAFYYRDLVILGKVASLNKNDSDEAHFAELASQVRDSFNQSFYDAKAHTYATGSQTSNAIPLVFGLAPEADRPLIVENIVKDVRKRNNGLTSGDIGYRYLLRALADGGRSDVIFDMNSGSNKPGYGMILAKGATSLTEAWDARPDSSQDHFMLGHIMEWFYSDLVGIQQETDSIAFRKIVIKPTPVGNVTSASGSYQSASGRIESKWMIRDSEFDLDVVIPPNTHARIVFPNRFSKRITENGNPVAAEMATGEKDGGVSLSVSSGTYHFVARSS